MLVHRTCSICARPFAVNPSTAKRSRAEFCSRPCFVAWQATQRPIHFWARIASGEPSACWDFTGKRDRKGYGKVSVGRNREMLAHRYAYELTYGPVPPETPQVTHLCDRPPCCNPSHLLADTVAGNARQMVERGRHGYATHPGYMPRGERHPNAILTDAQVAEICARYVRHVVTLKMLAAEYGVDLSTISYALRIRSKGSTHGTEGGQA